MDNYQDIYIILISMLNVGFCFIYHDLTEKLKIVEK